MHQKTISGQIFIAFFCAALAVLVSIACYVALRLHDFHYNHTKSVLLACAEAVARYPLAVIANSSTAQELCQALGQRLHVRITIMAADGKVLGDTARPPEGMESHRYRPEVTQALREEIGSAVRYSDTMQKNFLYIAVPVKTDGRIISVVRTAAPLQAVNNAFLLTLRPLLAGIAVLGGLFAIVAGVLARRISRPLSEMREVAGQIAGGELTARLRGDYRVEETAQLAQALNKMAETLQQRLDDLAKKNAEQEAVFGGMTEGVLAIDSQEIVTHMNAAAARLLGCQRSQALGHPLAEELRHPQFQEFVESIFAPNASWPVEAEITLRRIPQRRPEMFVQARGVPIFDAAGKKSGAVIVLTDITRLKQLEQTRRDFVANVSHELKTPLTAVKGGVETLLQEKERLPADLIKFAEMLARHVERMQRIIEDLLTLSQIEFDAEKQNIALAPVKLADLLHNAVAACAALANDKNIAVNLQVPEDLFVSANAPLLEQAVINLLHNAIKFSPPSSIVDLSAQMGREMAVISVKDYGPGIEPQHLPRLFERFYRVDRARSRELGGTGLGLAIVKHIALAHHGVAEVESTPGSGSIFTLRIPLAAPSAATSA